MNFSRLPTIDLSESHRYNTVLSGQLLATESASNVAIIKAYLETCVRNGMNEVDALIHLWLVRPTLWGNYLRWEAVNNNDES